MDESNTLIDCSEAGELVHNNSQWHPGFSALGSVPGTVPNGTMPPALETAVQATAVTVADQDLETEDEAEEEAEDQAGEEMDETDNFDDAYDEDALNEGEEVDPTNVSGVDQGTTSNQLSHIPDATEAEQLLPNESPLSGIEDSDLPDLEEIPVADQIDQQTTEGNK